MDPLSDVLELIGFKSSIYFQKNFCGHWKMSVANTGFAQFHFIVRGTAFLEYDGRIEQLSAGDLVLFPKGATHAISDHPDTPAMRGQDVIAAMEKGQEPFIEGPPTTRMVCGHFEYDLTHLHPFMRDLPPCILIRANELEIGSLMSALLPLIVSETRSSPLGGRIVTEHLSQALFASILRVHFDQDATKIGFYAGLRNDRIILAIAAIHEVDGWKYSLSDLAAIAGMSRSSFATKFKQHVGQTAGEYASTWRLLKARLALQDSRKTIDQVAHEHGYASASAFSRAFRDALGVSPSHARKSDTV
ncbi:MAG: AraC family transcriptional regulator [Paracoccaceae bacterium]